MQNLQPEDKPKKFEFVMRMLQCIDNDSQFLNHVCASSEAALHVCGKANRHNAGIWGSENLHHLMESVRNSPRVNVSLSLKIQ